MSPARLLDGIKSPHDLKRIPLRKLPRLAKEIRQTLLETVSKTGGHLASNLGVVELTIALHYAFDTPQDRIVWDVGHQGYPHKLLTGRLNKFDTIRQYDGISGFLSRKESPYDTFGGGHAATSVSAALGIAEALHSKGDNSKVIAVIGDGGLTCGLALEGLNHAGALEKDLIVVLNHNEMSISGNVGALSSWFSSKLAGPTYRRVRGDVKRTLSQFPTMGPEMIKMIRRVLESTKVLLTPGILFEGFNFQYVGPIDGHNIEAMIESFERVKDLEGPVLVQVVTQKGRGYKLAERDPERFHGLGAFDIATGRSPGPVSPVPSFTKFFGDALVEFAGQMNNVCAITAAMPSGTGLKDFAATFPDRFYDVGIAEGHAVTFAAGLASEGMKPVVAVYSTFLQRAIDMIIHDVALQGLPVLFALDRGGLVGNDGPTHHGAFDLTYLRMVPNLVVAAPKDEDELRDLLLTGLQYDGPFALRYPRGKGEGVTLKQKAKAIPIGKGEVVLDTKKAPDCTILAVGSRVWPAVNAATLLKKYNISCRVMNARFIKPLDEELLAAATADTDTIVTVEDNTKIGGFGSAVSEWMASNQVTGKKLLTLGLPDKFIPYGSQAELYAAIGIDSDGIIQAVRDFVRSS